MSEQTRRALRRGGVVSAGALCVVLAGGGLSLGGAVPGSDTGPLRTVTGSVDGAVQTVTGTEPTSVLPAPEPQEAPAPGPVRQVVRQVVTVVQDQLTAEPAPEAPGVPTAPGPGAKPQPKPQPTPRDAAPRPPKLPTVDSDAHRPAPGRDQVTTRALDAPAAVQRPAQLRERAAAPEATADFGASDTLGAVTPQLVPQLPTPSGDLPVPGGQGIPGVLAVIAVTAVAALGAGHFGVWQNSK